MKRFYPLMIAVLLLSVLAGCSNFEDSAKSSSVLPVMTDGNSRDVSTTALPGRPAMSVFMPEAGQTHEIGYLSSSTSNTWIKTWTLSRYDGAGSMLKTWPQFFPAGKYKAVFQVWHKQYAGKTLGELRAWNGSTLIASKTLISEEFADYNDGGYQRALLDFELPADSSEVYVELYYANNYYIWTGAVSITPAETRRPFYNIAHRCSTISKLDDMVSRGANAIECDLTPELVNGNIEFYVYHSGDTSYTHYNDFSAYVDRMKYYLDNQNIDLIELDCKQKSGIEPADFAVALANKLIEKNIDPSLVVMSVPGNIAGVFNDALKVSVNGEPALFDCGLDSYLESYSGLNADQWILQVEQTGASFVGVGIDPVAFWSPMSVWMSWIQTMTNRRDALGNLKKAYFWTLNTKASMRKCIDYNCDGIITNYPERLKEVLEEECYTQIVRPAVQSDNQFAVFGYEQ